MAERIANQGFAAEVLAEIDGISHFVCGFASEAECMAAITRRYVHDRIRVSLEPLSATACRRLTPPLKVGEVRVKDRGSF